MTTLNASTSINTSIPKKPISSFFTPKVIILGIGTLALIITIILIVVLTRSSHNSSNSDDVSNYEEDTTLKDLKQTTRKIEKQMQDKTFCKNCSWKMDDDCVIKDPNGSNYYVIDPKCKPLNDSNWEYSKFDEMGGFVSCKTCDDKKKKPSYTTNMKFCADGTITDDNGKSCENVMNPN